MELSIHFFPFEVYAQRGMLDRVDARMVRRSGQYSGDVPVNSGQTSPALLYTGGAWQAD